MGEPFTKTYSPSARFTGAAVMTVSVVTSVVVSEEVTVVPIVGTVVAAGDALSENTDCSGAVVTDDTGEKDDLSSDVSGGAVVVASSVLFSVVVVVSGTDIEIGGLVSASMTETSFSGSVVTADGSVSSQSASLPPPQPESMSAAASRAAMNALTLFLFIINLQSFPVLT